MVGWSPGFGGPVAAEVLWCEALDLHLHRSPASQSAQRCAFGGATQPNRERYPDDAGVPVVATLKALQVNLQKYK